MDKLFDGVKYLYDTKKIWIYLLNISCVVLLLLILLAYFIIYINSSSKKTYFLEELYQDFIKSPIFNFSNSQTFIFTSLEELPIPFAQYNGGVVGCKCIKDKINRTCNKEEESKGYEKENFYDINYETYCIYNEITKGECSPEQKLMECETVFPFFNKYFMYYKNTILYGKRNYLYSYEDLLTFNYVIEKNKECPINMKQCGIIDSFDNILCLDKSDICPLNNITIIQESDKKGIKLGDSTYLYFTNEAENNKTIADLYVFQRKPCYDSQEKHWKNFYELEDNNEGDCIYKKNEVDKKYVEVDSYNQSKFYEENKIYSRYGFKLKPNKMEKLKNSKIYLYYRNFIGYNLSCLKSKYKNLRDFRKDLSELKEIVDNERLFHATIFNLFGEIVELFKKASEIFDILSILFGIIFLLAYTNLDFISILSCLDFSKETNEYIKIIFKFLIPEIILVSILLYSIFSWEKKSPINYNELIDKIIDCCDIYTKDKLSKLKKTFDITSIWRLKYPIITLPLILLIIMIVFAIGGFILKFNFDIKFNDCCSNKDNNEHKPLMEEKSIELRTWPNK